MSHALTKVMHADGFRIAKTEANAVVFVSFLKITSKNTYLL